MRKWVLYLTAQVSCWPELGGERSTQSQLLPSDSEHKVQGSTVSFDTYSRVMSCMPLDAVLGRIKCSVQFSAQVS